MQIEEIFFRGKNQTEPANFATQWLLLLDPSSLANQNAGFALVY